MQKYHLFTPGPTMVPADVALAGAKAMIHHRTDQFKAIYNKCAAELQQLFETKQPVLVLLGSGTAAMEAAVDAVVARGEKIITLNGGKFGERWTKIGKLLGAEVHEVKYPWTDCATPAMLEEAIAACPEAVAVFTQLNETSTGVGNPVQALAEVCHKHNMLCCVDGISGLTAMKCPMDEWGLDIVLTGSQKGLMLPPGLAFISLSEKAIAKMAATPQKIFYNDFRGQLKNHEQSTHAWTSGVSLYQQLSVALDEMLADGLDTIIHRCHIQGDAIRAAAKAHGLELLNAKSPGDVLTPIILPESVKASALAKFMRGEWGIYMAAGQDDYKDKIIRIGHLGYQDHFETIMAIAAFEMALKHFGVDLELGKGVKVAQEILLADLVRPKATAASAG
jgi:aspartate aminotransferase-like enzyme